MPERTLRMEAEIALQNPRRYRSLEPSRLQAWLVGLIGDVAPDIDSFGVRFVDDSEIQELNLRFRGRDSSTDVLSFPGESSPEGRHLGDVVISVPTARRQAGSGNRPEATEIRLLLIHGVLHCLGYDHETDNGEMERVERRIRRRWLDDVD